MNKQSYVYKWTHLPTLKWYVGSRTARNCHPNDGYVCSSKEVKKMIKANPEQWKREVIHVGEDAYEVETEILQLFNARADSRSFNLWNNHEKMSMAGTKRPAHSMAMMGENNPNYGKGLKGELNHWHPIHGRIHPATGKPNPSVSKMMKERTGDKHPMKKPEFQITCEHCGKTVMKTNHIRWHGDRCKNKENK